MLCEIASGKATIDLQRIQTVIHREILETLDKVYVFFIRIQFWDGFMWKACGLLRNLIKAIELSCV